jgi:hypothetical protein
VAVIPADRLRDIPLSKEDPMAEQKIAKAVEVRPIPSDREGLLNSWINQGSELAEKATVTGFGIARDVRGELNQRVSGTLTLIDGSQQGLIKLVRGVNDRLDKLTEDTLDTVENVVLGLIRTARDTGRGVTDLATHIARPRETSRAA